MAFTFENPPVPFKAGVANGRLQDGDVIAITGNTFPGASRIEFNLIGLSVDDYALHFNPRFDQESFVRNAKIDGDWGDEETDGYFHLRDGEEFYLEIHVRADGYHIEMNQRTVCFFSHRLSHSDVRAFAIDGDLQIRLIQFKRDDGNLSWVPTAHGEAPSAGEMIYGGSTVDGETLYVGRCWHESGDLLVGKIHPSHGCLFVPYDCGEHSYVQYEALVAFGGERSTGLQWKPASNGEIPPGAFVGGHTNDGEALYVARAHHEGDLLPGKLHPSHGGCYVAWGDEEHKQADYEVLCTSASVFSNISGPNRIDYPLIPFSTNLPDAQLYSGASVTVKAVPQSDDRFAINFAGDSDDDIALHFNPRIADGHVVRNHAVGGGWGDEETDGGMPFAVGEEFKLRITIQPDSFYIEVNKRRFATFSHRMPIQLIRNFNIKGDGLQVVKIEFEKLKYIPYVPDYSFMNSPALPYATPVPRGHLYPGTTVVVRGCPRSGGDRFELNFKNGDDIHFHLNPRFADGHVVRNAAPGGDWQDEETDGDSPFVEDETFDLTIAAKDDCFKVKVNGHKFCEFDYRLPADQVTHFDIDGDVDVYSVEFKERMPQREPQVYSAPLPFRHQIPGGLYPGRIVVVHGIPQGGRFNVNLLTPEEDHSLHFDVRHSYGGDSQVIVMNSSVDGEWGTEDRDVPGFPFEDNQPFQIMIRSDYDKYLIAVNGQHFVEYPGRIFPISRVDALTIEGDVEVIMVDTP